MALCAKCNNELLPNAEFCHWCGTPVAEIHIPAEPKKITLKPVESPELGVEHLSLLRRARLVLGGLLVLLFPLVIWASTFWPSAPTSFSYFLIAIGVLVGGWFVIVFLLKIRLGKLGVSTGLPRTIAMVFRRQTKVDQVPSFRD